MARLEISNVTNSDQGEYKAVARNKFGEGVATINLNFEGTGKPKYIYHFITFNPLKTHNLFISLSKVYHNLRVPKRRKSGKISSVSSCLLKLIILTIILFSFNF